MKYAMKNGISDIMEHLPTLRQMQYLLALQDHKSFQKAADACAVTQSTLSGGLRDMEAILGTPVIDRTNRKSVRFTDTGRDLLSHARDIIAKMEDITYRARRSGKPMSWPLRMGVIPTIAPYLLPALLKPVKKAFPDLELHIDESLSGDIVEKLHDGKLDFALMAFPFDTRGLVEHPVMSEKFHLAAPPGAFAKNKTVRMEDLKDEKILLLGDGHCLRHHALDACETKPKEARTLSAASLSTLIQMVNEGYGITLLPEMSITAAAALPKGLVIRDLGKAAPTRQIGFAWKKGALREADIKTLTDFFGTRLKTHKSAKAA